MKRKRILLLTITLMMSSMIAYAQPGNGNGPPFPCPPRNPVCGGQPGLPIDNGLPILLLAGVIFGAYKIYHKRTKIVGV